MRNSDPRGQKWQFFSKKRKEKISADFVSIFVHQNPGFLSGFPWNAGSGSVRRSNSVKRTLLDLRAKNFGRLAKNLVFLLLRVPSSMLSFLRIFFYICKCIQVFFLKAWIQSRPGFLLNASYKCKRDPWNFFNFLKKDHRWIQITRVSDQHWLMRIRIRIRIQHFF